MQTAFWIMKGPFIIDFLKKGAIVINAAFSQFLWQYVTLFRRDNVEHFDNDEKFVWRRQNGDFSQKTL